MLENKIMKILPAGVKEIYAEGRTDRKI